jgi:hypothetical protein
LDSRQYSHACEADPPGLGQHFEEEPAVKRSPAVATRVLGREPARDLRQRLRIAAEESDDVIEVFGGEKGLRRVCGCVGFELFALQPGDRSRVRG